MANHILNKLALKLMMANYHLANLVQVMWFGKNQTTFAIHPTKIIKQQLNSSPVLFSVYSFMSQGW